MITVLLLADRPESIPILARWHHAQWPDYSGSQTVEDAERRIQAWMNRDRLPIGLAAYLDGQLAGAAVLRENAMGSRPDFGPGLGALLVAEPFRRRGVATALVAAGMEEASRLGMREISATTDVARSIFERLGWDLIEEFTHDGESLACYRCSLKDANGAAARS